MGNFLQTHWPWIAVVLDIVLATGVTIHAVLWKRDTRAVIGWVGLAWLAPFVGVIAYVCLGINRIQRKGEKLQLRGAWGTAPALELMPEEEELRDHFVERYPHFVGLANLGRHVAGRRLLPGNEIDPLRNGDEAYPAMVQSIRDARRSVALLSYIFDSDRAGDMFMEALVDAGERGVEVRVLVDDVGSKYSKPNMVRRLKAAGLEAAGFLPTRIPRLPKYANMRNHRKILVCDGTTAYTGGTNIREGHCLDWDPEYPVACLHFRLRGPVVPQLQEAFAVDWAFTTGELLTGEPWFPPNERVGHGWARGIAHGPDEDFEKIVDVLAGALSVAQRRVRVVTPYFLPHGSLVHALTTAAMRGVEVEIFVPEAGNVALVQWAADAQWWQFLEKGCRVFRTAAPFDHTKLVLVDGIWSLIGSTNWDPRSLRLNFEYNVECYDQDLVTALDAIVDEKRSASSEVTLDDVTNVGYPVRLRNGLARLLSPYL